MRVRDQGSWAVWKVCASIPEVSGTWGHVQSICHVSWSGACVFSARGHWTCSLWVLSNEKLYLRCPSSREMSVCISRFGSRCCRGMAKTQIVGFTGLKARVYFTFRVPFRLAHSRLCTAFNVYSTVDECGRTSSTHAQYYLLDLRCLNNHLAHALLYAHGPRGLKKLPARGRGARLSASPPDDENDVMRTVRRRGWPKYTLALRRSFWVIRSRG